MQIIRSVYVRLVSLQTTADLAKHTIQKQPCMFISASVAASASYRCSIIQGCRICNNREEKGHSSYPPTPLNASIHIFMQWRIQYASI